MKGHCSVWRHFGCYNWLLYTVMYRVEAREAIKHPTGQRTASHDKELSGPKDQQC